jgi:hypothetical protein
MVLFTILVNGSEKFDGVLVVAGNSILFAVEVCSQRNEK